MKKTPGFTAEDGKWFATKKECEVYEKSARILLIGGCSVIDMEAALDGKQNEFASAVEWAGNIIARKRRESGDVRRRKKNVDGKASK